MKERISRLALKVAAILSSITIVIAVEPYFKLSGDFEFEFGRPEVVAPLHDSETTISAPMLLEVE